MTGLLGEINWKDYLGILKRLLLYCPNSRLEFMQRNHEKETLESVFFRQLLKRVVSVVHKTSFYEM